MTLGELLIAITLFCNTSNFGRPEVAVCITNLHQCSIQDKHPLEGYQQRYVQCLKEKKWK